MFNYAVKFIGDISNWPNNIDDLKKTIYEKDSFLQPLKIDYSLHQLSPKLNAKDLAEIVGLMAKNDIDIEVFELVMEYVGNKISPKFKGNILQDAAYSGNYLVCNYMIENFNYEIDQHNKAEALRQFSLGQIKYKALNKLLIDRLLPQIDMDEKITTLKIAAKCGNCAQVKYIINNEKDIELADKIEALSNAQKNNHVKIAKFIIENILISSDGLNSSIFQNKMADEINITEKI
jgi:hypothetical protein